MPDLILADYNLPNGMNGIEFTAKLRQQLARQIPAIILTGDISISALGDISGQGCIQLNKPVKLKELSETIGVLLRTSQSAVKQRAPPPAEGGRCSAAARHLCR